MPNDRVHPMRYEDVPKGVKENLAFRRAVLEECVRNRRFQQGVKQACAKDVRLWANLFLWTYDPRKIRGGGNPNLPFITWPFQDETLLTLDEHFGKRNIGIEKSRDMGASWMCLVVFLRQWQFFPGRAMMLVSRNERLVEQTSNPDSLFWKIDFMLERQPHFLLPRGGPDGYVRTKLNLSNLENGSTISGASTTADVGRGGRQTAILMDEYGAFEIQDGYAANAATANNTECRVFNSTYKAATGAFYDQMQRPDTYPEHDDGIVKISLPWWKHPEHAEGLYEAQGKKRSPWYDRKAKEIVVPALIAMELDMDPEGASSLFFPSELIERILSNDVRPPIARGRLEHSAFDPKSHQWLEDPTGELLLWFTPGAQRKPDPSEEFVIGCDISQGTGATNSVLSVASKRTREKVAELATPNMSPDVFAAQVAAVGYWFNEAQVIWEMNGPGGAFGKRLVDLGYRNIYYRQDEQGLRHKVAEGMVPGWHASPANKMLVFREYVRALASGSFINRSREAIRECRHYIYLPDGSVGSGRAYSQTDPSGARANHGDRPTADVLCNKLLGSEPEVQVPRVETEDDPLGLKQVDPPVGSRAWAFQQEMERVGSTGWESPRLRGWDERSMVGW